MIRGPLLLLAASLPFLATLAPAAPPAPEGGNAVLQRLVERAGTHGTLQLSFTQEISAMGQPMRVTGRMQTAGGRTAMTMQTALPGGETMEQRIVVLPDVAWVYMPAMNIVMKMDIARMGAAASAQAPFPQQSPLGLVEGLRGGSMKHLGGKEIGGVACQGFRGTVAGLPSGALGGAAGLPADGVAEVWIGEADGVPRMLRVLGQDGAALFTQTFTDIVLDQPIPEQTFAFKVPEGAQVMDMSDMLQQKLPGSGDAPPDAAPPAAPAPDGGADEY